MIDPSDVGVTNTDDDPQQLDNAVAWGYAVTPSAGSSGDRSPNVVLSFGETTWDDALDLFAGGTVPMTAAVTGPQDR